MIFPKPQRFSHLASGVTPRRVTRLLAISTLVISLLAIPVTAPSAASRDTDSRSEGLQSTPGQRVNRQVAAASDTAGTVSLEQIARGHDAIAGLIQTGQFAQAWQLLQEYLPFIPWTTQERASHADEGASNFQEESRNQAWRAVQARHQRLEEQLLTTGFGKPLCHPTATTHHPAAQPTAPTMENQPGESKQGASLLNRIPIRLLLTRVPAGSGERVQVVGRDLTVVDGQRTYPMGRRLLFEADPTGVHLTGSQRLPDGLGSPERPVVITTEHPPLRINIGAHQRFQVRGTLHILPTGEAGEMQVILHDELESLVQALLARTAHGAWPQAALKAQAIVIRSAVLYHLYHHDGALPYDLTGENANLPFDGVHRESAPLIRAAEESRGRIITASGEEGTNGEGVPLWSPMTLNNGGRMAVLNDLFGTTPRFAPHAVSNSRSKPIQPPWMRPDADPWSAKARMTEWSRAYPHPVLKRMLRTVGFPAFKGDRVILTVARRDPTGRVLSLSAKTARDDVLTFPAHLLFDRAMALPSRLITTIGQTATGIVIHGRGSGHGVGYSQWGGVMMARGDKESEEILDYYFPGTRRVVYSGDMAAGCHR